MTSRVLLRDEPAPRSRWKRSALGALLLASTGLAGIFGSSFWVRRSANGKIVTLQSALAAHRSYADVVIVLGARVYADGSVSPALEDRLYTAWQLYRSGVVTKILLSGDHRRARYDEVNAMLRWMLLRGVPTSALYLDHAGFRTLDTMLRAARIFRVRRAFVATQEFHLARAIFLADYAGIETLGVIADRRIYPDARRDSLRETLARTRAVFDRYVLRLGPTLGGQQIPIDGPASATHDRYSRLIHDLARKR